MAKRKSALAKMAEEIIGEGEQTPAITRELSAPAGHPPAPAQSVAQPVAQPARAPIMQQPLAPVKQKLVRINIDLTAAEHARFKMLCLHQQEQTGVRVTMKGILEDYIRSLIAR